MTLVVTDAIVLHVFDYLESSRILKLVTREAGVRSVLARGARKSKRRFGAALDLYAQGSAELQIKVGRELDTLGAFDVTRARPQLAAQLDRFTGASAIAELTLRFARDASDPGLFDAVLTALDDLAIAAPDRARDVTLGGAWRVLSELGVAPTIDDCAECHAAVAADVAAMFSHPAGGVLCQRVCAPRAQRTNAAAGGAGRATRLALRRTASAHRRAGRARAPTTPSGVRARAPRRRSAASRVRRLGARRAGRAWRAGVIIGTAGHIDHGKTTLVRALTGVDTDRLPEEKRRGITIELGFAPLALDGIGTIGVVDVPGHEAFVRTMVAGATGIDIALLVVAADEGVMPQTREHLAILRLLGVRRGVVALTKADLVDDEWLALVEEDVRAAIASVLPDAPIVATAAQTGRGIAELRSALVGAARAVPHRSDDDLFRMPVDRAFTIKGTGTVVTGTVWSGRVARDETVRIFPGGQTARVRGIQGHGEQLDASEAGGRTAVALTGLEPSDVPRGSTLVADASWRSTMLARADVTLVPGAEASIRPRTWFRAHVGTAEVGARVVAKEVRAGEPFAARVVFDQQVLIRAGDRFVLRTSAPLNTIGGGVVVDPYPPRRARPWPTGLGRTGASRATGRRGGAGRRRHRDVARSTWRNARRVCVDRRPIRRGACRGRAPDGSIGILGVVRPVGRAYRRVPR